MVPHDSKDGKRVELDKTILLMLVGRKLPFTGFFESPEFRELMRIADPRYTYLANRGLLM